MPEVQEATVETAATESATSQQVETKEVATSETESKETAKASESTETVDLEDVEVSTAEDGTKEFTFKVDPDDPKSSVYKGKSLGELMKNIRNGVKEKDTYIGKLKANEIKVPDKFKEGKEDEAPEIEAPNEEEIYQKHLEAEVKRTGVRREMMNWNNQDWKTYQIDNSLESWEIQDLRDQVKSVRQNVRVRADREIGELTIVSINKTILDQETQGVRELIAESGIDAEKFDYDKVLDSCYKNNRNKQGVFVSGSIVKEAAKEINRMLKAQGESKLKQRVVEEIAKGQEAKDKIKSPSGSGAKKTETEKAPKNYDDGFAEAVKMLRK